MSREPKQQPMENAPPFSEAAHNPYWCGGDNNGQCCGDDPCWSCIHYLHAAAMEANDKIAALSRKISIMASKARRR